VAERWTAEIEDLVRSAIADPTRVLGTTDTYDTMAAWGASAVLTALAEAGLLLPPDVEAHRQYGRKMPNGRVLASSLPDPTHYRLNGPWRPVDTEETT